MRHARRSQRYRRTAHELFHDSESLSLPGALAWTALILTTAALAGGWHAAVL